jgi:hypothetical protein
MRFNNVFIAFAVVLAFSGCRKDDPIVPNPGGGNNGSSSGVTINPNAPNVMKVGVNDPELCSSGSYTNKPCVAVTICAPGGSPCQTVNDILLDTGSYGLRIFKQPIASLTLGNSPAGEVAECMEYGDGSKQWGPIKIAHLKMGNAPGVDVPVQVIDFTYPGMNDHCSGAEKYPGQGSTFEYAGFNGILGVGVFQSDCGPYCASEPDNNVYFNCAGGTCKSRAMPETLQVQNPVGFLPVDNNGVILKLPSVALGGNPQTNGWMIFGIGTRDNNKAPSNVTRLRADPQFGEITTQFGSQDLQSFIDTGSNAYALPSFRGLPNCGGELSGWFCPTTVQSYTANAIGYGGGPNKSISFHVGNFRTLFNSGNEVFSESAFEAFANINGFFAWGLPFYFGKTVYQGLEKQSSSLGSGEYWAW